MSLKCINIEALRNCLADCSSEEKPNGQIKHKFKEGVVNTYDTGSIVIQDNSEDKILEKKIIALVSAINGINQSSCK